MQELINDYFSAVYGECAGEMQTAFGIMRAQMQKQEQYGLLDGGIWKLPLTQAWWGKGAMEQMLSILATAKTKANQKQLYFVKKEEIFPRFVLKAVYGVSDDALLADAKELGISLFSEVKTLAEYFNEQGN